jgi:prophage regulatory protein
MAAQIQSALTILRRKQVEARTGLSRSTIYLRISQGTFPPPVKLGGPRAVGWIESEIEAWLSRQVEQSRQAKA